MESSAPGLSLTQSGKRQSYRLLMLVGVICLVMHAAFIPLFAAANATRLALFNIWSVAAWTTGLLLGRAGKVTAGLILIQIEGISHAIVAVHYLGLGAGFQQYLIPLAACAFIVKPRRVLSASVATISVAAYVALNYYEPSPPPDLEPWVERLWVPNTIAALLIAIIAIWYYMKMLDRAEAISESLLNNVFPSVIAAELKERDKVIPKSYEQASILFADIEGFTPFSERVRPDDVVKMLDEVFSCFDKILERHGLEKIKTIGDAYMAVAGIPNPRTDHAAALARFALDIRGAFIDYAAKQRNGLRLRIGMHTSGPVVAGVVGERRFLYDLWGDAVNTASRMESHGVANEIQVTEETYRILCKDFVLEARGFVEIKGKGTMRTFLLKGARA